MKPGSDKAIAQGCICPVMDNQSGIGGMLQQPVINLECPIHGDKKPQATEVSKPRVRTLKSPPLPRPISRPNPDREKVTQVTHRRKTQLPAGASDRIMGDGTGKKPDPDTREKMAEWFWDNYHQIPPDSYYGNMDWQKARTVEYTIAITSLVAFCYKQADSIIALITSELKKEVEK